MGKSNKEVDKTGYVKLTAAVLAEINEGRVENGMKPITVRLRNCLTCDKQFKSEGSHERRCSKCKAKNLDAGQLTTTSVMKD